MELEPVPAEHGRLVSKRVPAPEVRTMIARNEHSRAAGEQILPLKQEVETCGMVGGVTLGLCEVVHVVNGVSDPISSRAEDNEHEVVHLFLILVVLVNEVSEDEHLTRFEVVLDHLDKLARGLVVSLRGSTNFDRRDTSLWLGGTTALAATRSACNFASASWAFAY